MYFKIKVNDMFAYYAFKKNIIILSYKIDLPLLKLKTHPNNQNHPHPRNGFRF